ncbi:MAG: isoprenylcysteine carboxylmethyltransferase family protein [Methylohalobius crimeensis]
MLAHALLAFIVLPGIFAIAVPVNWLMASSHAQMVQPLGLIPLVAGFLGLLWCARDFYVSGKGTLAPWAPPRRLVVVGFYRYTRNPMYFSVVLLLLGWAVAFHSLGLFVYAVMLAAIFQVRVVLGEEPWLARAHGKSWEEYSRRVPRWLW